MKWSGDQVKWSGDQVKWSGGGFNKVICLITTLIIGT